MSNVNQIQDNFKVIDEILNRIFNHHPLIDAQMTTTVKTFEENKKLNEADRVLDNCLNAIDNVRKIEINEALKLCDEHFPIIGNKIDKVHDIMETILKKETVNEQKRLINLQNYINQQDDILQDYLNKVNQQINEAETSFNKAKDNISKEFQLKCSNKNESD